MLERIRTEYSRIHVPIGTPEGEVMRNVESLARDVIEKDPGINGARVLTDLFKPDEQLVPNHTTYVLILYFFL